MDKRYNILDFFRGFTILHMIIYHTIFSLEVFSNHNLSNSFFSTKNLYFYQQYICISFIFIAGLSSNLSRNFKKRVLILFLVSLGITLCTFLFDKNNAIFFGVIHFFFAASLIHMLFKNLIEKLDKKFGTIISLILFIIFKNIYNGNIFFNLINLPKSLYKHNLFFLGLPSDNFYSADYFPIIPWIFLYFFGYFLFSFLNLNKKTPSKNIFNILGRHSLLIYVIHQPIIILILKLINF